MIKPYSLKLSDRNATDNVSNEVLEFFQKSCTVALRRLFALDSLSQDAKLKHSKLSYVFTSTNSADHEKIYGLQSLEGMDTNLAFYL